MRKEIEGWHHVAGATGDELARNREEAYKRYGDIIHCPRPVSKSHKPMDMESRAAQFSPFAALDGYNDAIDGIVRDG